MATDINLAAVRRFWDGFNAHNLAVWDELCTASFVNHDPGLPNTGRRPTHHQADDRRAARSLPGHALVRGRRACGG